MNNSTSFRIGNYRPIYLWAGPGTVRMNQLKFMGVNVDVPVHMSAHQGEGVNRVVNNFYQNWIHLTYNWGFPPEIEKEDWDSFEIATQEYHRRNAKVFAYIQTSNCVYDGSFKDKNWYALDPNGEKIYYYSGRYLTCFQNPEWTAYLHERISDAINRQSDGIFFDNLWYGLQPNSLFNTWLGGAGCYCPTCQEIYHREVGLTIPRMIDLKHPDVINYLQWRSQKMTDVFQELSSFARNLKPGIFISANDYDPVMRPVKLIFGIDFSKLAEIQDVTMIENFALPKWEPKLNSLVNNALTLRNSQAFLPEKKHLSVISYATGIGFDPVYPIRQTLTGMAEAAALGCSMVTKGTEYHDGEKMTLLTAPEYTSQQNEIGLFHHWLEDYQAIYQHQTTRIAPVEILHPGDLLWQKWHTIAPLFFAVQQTLLANGIPWVVITNPDQGQQNTPIIVFEKTEPEINLPKNNLIIRAHELSNWIAPKESIFNRNLFLRRILSFLADKLIRGYHGSKSMRTLMDWFGMSKLVTHTPFFKLPDLAFQNDLLKSLEPFITFRVFSKFPVLIDVWETTNSEVNIHLVNYHPQKQKVQLKLPNQSKINIIQPDLEPQFFETLDKKITIDLDIYCICMIQNN